VYGAAQHRIDELREDRFRQFEIDEVERLKAGYVELIAARKPA
jgi:hypothetical protein